MLNKGSNLTPTCNYGILLRNEHVNLHVILGNLYHKLIAIITELFYIC